jgi:hypothetical protein
MSEFEFEIKILLKPFNLQEKSRAIGEVIDNGADSG